MTRHCYHENEAILRQAVDAIPAFGSEEIIGNAMALSANGEDNCVPATRRESIPASLKRLGKYLEKCIVTEAEYTAARQRILAEM